MRLIELKDASSSDLSSPKSLQSRAVWKMKNVAVINVRIDQFYKSALLNYWSVFGIGVDKNRVVPAEVIKVCIQKGFENGAVKGVKQNNNGVTDGNSPVGSSGAQELNVF